MKHYRKVLKTKQEHPFFKMRRVRERLWLSDRVYEAIEYQCPACKNWHRSSYGTMYNTAGVRLHITKAAKIEAVAHQLGEVKNIPHFELWKKNTQPINALYKPREWKFI